MLETAKKEGYAYPAVNVTTIEVINGALRAFSEAKSDGIIQVSIGGGKFASGTSVGSSAIGAIVLAEATRRLAEEHKVLVGLHTDHCQPEHVDTFLRPLLAESRRRVERGEAPLFNSHMLDASTLPMAENLKLSQELLKECAELGIVLEIEIGVVGGEEDGVDNSGHPADKLYTSPEDMLMTYEALAPLGKFMLAATFGNVHGAYKPGVVKLRPELLHEIQQGVWNAAKSGELNAVLNSDMPDGKPFELVFHGGSGSTAQEIAEAVSYGVIKMNIDTDTQYAFTRAVAGHMFRDYDGVLKIDGEEGNKKQYDPRSSGREPEESMEARVVEACDELGSAGRALKKCSQRRRVRAVPPLAVVVLAVASSLRLFSVPFACCFCNFVLLAYGFRSIRVPFLQLHSPRGDRRRLPLSFLQSR